ncbi:unnamed protein product [Triticum turgidum subsp. durum]|uniref:Reverse transcriptase zinc-binding domain-containing protein n=1 Tax=Triticum turgidum subsp. durum TaxID=4567 RepID=A0A9R0QI31_TRITD|nr:unnamed protein product [Triticum turgidum subsp. durum]
METASVCTICGQENETAHHALIRCPHARNLWNEMKNVWNLPPDDALRNSKPDWLLMLLQELNDTQRMLVIMVFWRLWHVHNELTHYKPMIPIEASKQFLCGYVDYLLMIKHYLQADITKGKFPADLSGCITPSTHMTGRLLPDVTWVPPPAGHVKLNFDGSYVALRSGRRYDFT